MKRAVRFAVAVDGRGSLEPWQLDAVERLLAAGGAEIVAAVRVGKTERASRAFAPFARSVRRLPLALLGDLAVLDEAPRTGLDFVLSFAGPECGSGMPVWWFACGEGHERAGEPLIAWELIDRKAHVTAELRCTEPDGTVRVLRRGAFKTTPHSWARTRAEVLGECAHWPAQAHLTGGRGLGLPDRQAAGRGTPGAVGTARLAAAIAAGRVRFAFSGLLRHGNWNIGVVPRRVGELVDGAPRPRIEWLPRRRDGYVADPFVVEHGGRTHVFCEEFPYDTRRGVIAHFELSGGRASDREVVLELDGHASYPCVVEDDGAFYMVPETSYAGEVSLYRADAFPRGWRKVATLLEGVAGIDPTVFRHRDRWWLFATVADRGPHLNLFAWHAEQLAGPWRPHAMNPIKTDVRSARPAGRPFTHRGVLHRPAQDCSSTYGGRVVVNRVDALSPTEYAETPVAVAEPEPDGAFPLGLHTLATAGEWALVDGKRMIPRSTVALRDAINRRFAWPAPTPVLGEEGA